MASFIWMIHRRTSWAARLRHVSTNSRLGREKCLPVKGTSETLETSAVRQERIRQGTSNQVSGVSRDITTLMITVKSKVKSQKILKVLVLLSALSKHSSKVVR